MNKDKQEISMSPEQLGAELEAFGVAFRELKTEIQRAVVGYDELLTDTLVAIFAGGHVLLEGVPGLGKTFLVKVISRVLGVESGRVQCTPDLMPADILGTQIVNEDDHGRRTLHFERGPVFRNILLVDEINRATPKTQAALLEAMQEHAVTTGGERFELPAPFFVLATQNPMEMEGTYPLPEAQLDRFVFKLRVPFPSEDELIEISRRTTGFDEADLDKKMSGAQLMHFQRVLSMIPLADPLAAFAARLVLATHPEGKSVPAKVTRFVSYGASPRGMQALVRAGRIFAALDGRTAVSVDDLKRAAKPSLRHRLILNFEGEAESVDVDQLLEEIIATIPPAGQAAARAS